MEFKSLIHIKLLYQALEGCQNAKVSIGCTRLRSDDQRCRQRGGLPERQRTYIATKQMTCRWIRPD